MRLIIAEKPSVALDIARVLGSPQRHEGYVSVGHDTITWAYGHLVTLAPPDVYNLAWKTWSWSTLPMLPEPFLWVPIAKTADHLQRVIELMQQAERIVEATDADRVGEEIFRNIYHLAHISTPVDRLWLSENTPAAIRQALESMKPYAAYDALAEAAQARSQADWLVGLNATRAFSLRHGQPGHPLSVGRVQTPTLQLIATRDNAISTFHPTPYWEIHVTFASHKGQYIGIWQGEDKEHPARLSTREDAQSLTDRLSPGTPGQIVTIERVPVTLKPPLLFNLNDLQKEANRRLGLTAQDTLDAAQHLYDQHMTSYPRTEARTITKEIAATLGKRLAALSIGPAALTVQSQAGLSSRAARLINEKEVSEAGHYAIIPTGQRIQATLSPRDKAVYDLIQRRFLAALLPAGLDERTTLWTEVGGDRFKTTGTAVVEPGWRAALAPDSPSEDEVETPDTIIPPGLQSHDPVSILDTTIKETATKAPARLTDASLLALMEKHGLGTPATRARILEILLTRQYVVRDKKALVSTTKGRQLLEVVPNIIREPELTGHWEQQLEAIAQGRIDSREFLSGIAQLTRDLISHARGQDSHVIRAPGGIGPCPVCHQGEVMPNRVGWGCSRYKQGCRFLIYRQVAGKSLTEVQVKTLVAGKTTRRLKGFVSKAGKPFEARMRLDGPDARITFVFDEPAQQSGASGHRTSSRKSSG